MFTRLLESESRTLIIVTGTRRDSISASSVVISRMRESTREETPSQISMTRAQIHGEIRHGALSLSLLPFLSFSRTVVKYRFVADATSVARGEEVNVLLGR